MQSKAKECLETPEAERARNRITPTAFGESMGLLKPKFRLLAFRIVRE